MILISVNLLLLLFYRKEMKERKSRERMTRAKRYGLIGLASIGGGLLIGISGGLVAPLIGAGIGSVIGGTALLTTLTSSAIMASLFGAAGAGLTGKYLHFL